MKKNSKKQPKKKDLKNKLIAYRITEEQYDKASKLGGFYGMQPQEYARMLFIRQIPEEELRTLVDSKIRKN